MSDSTLYELTINPLAAHVGHAELVCRHNGWSFPDLLRQTLEEVERQVRADGGICRTRPGSWEADHLRALVAGAEWAV